MCGLFGGISGRGAPDINIIKTLGILNQERGEDSCGISFGHTLLKGAGVEAKWTKFIQKNKIEFKPSDHVVIGHVRKRTQGIANERNAHPFKIPIINKEGKDYCIIGAHNGNITNWRELCTKAGLTPSDYEVDSHAAYALIGRSFRKGDYSFFENYIGKAALIWTFSDEDAIYAFHGESRENNSNFKEVVSEERPLHYWTDTKKNITYFSSEAGPLESIATNNEDVHKLPYNKIFKFTSTGMEVVAEIPRHINSYQSYYEYVNHTTSVPNRNINTRRVDDGDFDRRLMTLPNKTISTSLSTENGLIILNVDLITKGNLKPRYVSLLDIYLLEDKFENGNNDNQIVFVKSRYYRNGHLADGIMYLDKNGKSTNRRFNKKDLKVSVNEGGTNVAYSKYYFSDGLLFASEADYTKYLKIVNKGLKNDEARVLPSAKPRSAHADFIKRVVKEGVKFLAPVSTLTVTDPIIILPKGEKESKEVINQQIPFTDTQFIISDGKLKAVIYPSKGEIVADKNSVVFNTVSTTQNNTPARNLDIIELFEEEPSKGYIDKKDLRSIPWKSLMFDYGTGNAYAYDTANDVIKAILAFWPISLEEYNNFRSGYYSPIQWTPVDMTLTIPEFNERITQINQSKSEYEAARKKFFDDIEWYKKLENYTLTTAKDIALITEFKGKSRNSAESYSEPVEEKSLNTLISKKFIDLCHIAGMPVNKKASTKIDEEYFIDWANCLIWDISRDKIGEVTGLFRAYKFSLKQDVAQSLPILLTKYKLEDKEEEFLYSTEFANYLNNEYDEKAHSQYKKAYIEALMNRGYVLADLNDYDAFIEELGSNKREMPINGNDELDTEDPPFTPTKTLSLVDNTGDAMLEASNLKYILTKNIKDIEITVNDSMKSIHTFLRDNDNISLLQSGLVDYMNLLALMKTKIEAVFRQKLKPLSDKTAVLEIITKDEENVKKLSQSYFKHKESKIGDVLTSSGSIYREKKDPKDNETLYTLVGSWKPINVEGNVELEFDIDSKTTNTIHLDEIFGLTLPVLINREKIVVQILKYRCVICKIGEQKTISTTSLM